LVQNIEIFNIFFYDIYDYAGCRYGKLITGR